MRHIAALALVLLTGCYTDATNCTPTTLEAEDADKVDLRAVSRSSVLKATLRTAAGPVGGKRLIFEVRDDGATVYEGGARTDSRGAGSYDLKRVDQTALVALARGDEYLVTFDGDTTYCSSSDEADFRVLNT